MPLEIPFYGAWGFPAEYSQFLSVWATSEWTVTTETMRGLIRTVLSGFITLASFAQYDPSDLMRFRKRDSKPLASPLRSRDRSEYSVAPTSVFSVLYWSFVIGHDRRRNLHFNIAMHSTSRWTMHQLREAFPFDSAPRFLIFDRDAKCGLVKRIEERHRWVCYSVSWEQFPSAC